jgi:hypothetical protein
MHLSKDTAEYCQNVDSQYGLVELTPNTKMLCEKQSHTTFSLDNNYYTLEHQTLFSSLCPLQNKVLSGHRVCVTVLPNTKQTLMHTDCISDSTTHGHPSWSTINIVLK